MLRLFPVLVLSSLLGCAVSSAQESEQERQAKEPTSASQNQVSSSQQAFGEPLLQQLYDPARLPRLQSGAQVASFSSYDRLGANDDGFLGTYSKLRVENGNSVIAEMEGPGVIQRIWTTHSAETTDGVLAGKGEHIQIYIDGARAPVLDVPLIALFDGSLERFPNPIAGSGLGGLYSYVPIAYAKSCKLVIEGTAVHFYQVDYRSLADATSIEPFSMAMTTQEQDDLANAIARWREPLAITRDENVEPFTAMLEPGDTTATVLGGSAARASLVLGVVFEGSLGEGEIEAHGTGPDSADVKLPLQLFFGSSPDGDPYDSLLMGARGDLHYNLFPFYSRGTFTYTIHAGAGTNGTMTAYALAIDDVPGDIGRLSAQVNESSDGQTGTPHRILSVRGRGHHVGTYLATEGPDGLPVWLEGDDEWTIDGTLRIHGTGTEDYFNCGWYSIANRLDHAQGFPTHGFPVFVGDGVRRRAEAYRWHLADPVPFETSIDVEIERGDQNGASAEYRSVAWYYAEP